MAPDASVPVTQTFNVPDTACLHMRWLVALVLLLPGCVEDRTYALSGSFTAERSQADIGELRQLGEDHGGNVQIMESSPEGFIVSGMSQQECDDLHATLLEKEYLATVGACAVEDDSGPY